MSWITSHGWAFSIVLAVLLGLALDQLNQWAVRGGGK